MNDSDMQAGIKLLERKTRSLRLGGQFHFKAIQVVG